MTLAEAIRAKILSSDVIAQIVGDRVYAAVAREKTDYPYIVYTFGDRVPDPSSGTLDGDCLWRYALSFTVVSKEWSGANLLAALLADFLENYSGALSDDVRVQCIATASGPRDMGFEEISSNYRFDWDTELITN